jgi:hypothetical protein
MNNNDVLVIQSACFALPIVWFRAEEWGIIDSRMLIINVIISPWPFIPRKGYCRCLRPSVRPSVWNACIQNDKASSIMHVFSRTKVQMREEHHTQSYTLGFYEIHFCFSKSSFELGNFSTSGSSLCIWGSVFKIIRFRQLFMDFNVLWPKWKRNIIRRAVILALYKIIFRFCIIDL